MIRRNSFFVFTLALLLLAFQPAPATGGIFGGTEHIIDEAGIFTPEQKKSLAAYHEKLLEVYDVDYRVIAKDSVGDINTYAYKTFGEMKIGGYSKTGRGLLLVIDPQQNQLRLEVSKGLEGVYTDAFVSYIEHRQMIPFFKASRVADGILGTTEIIFSRSADALAGNDFDPEKLEGTAGGGVTNAAAIGAGMEAKSTTALSAPAAALSPDEIVALYLTAMQERNSNPNLQIYSAETQTMMQKWVVTAAQMDNIVKSYLKCTHDNTAILGAAAVVRYRIEDRICSPYFLVYENDGWKLDLTMMQKAIRFNHMNYWHFDSSSAALQDYMFAFQDWQFDNHGFPHPGRKLRWYLTVGTYRDTGTIVEWVGKNSPAEHLGFNAGDRILMWNNMERPHHKQIAAYMDQAPEGDPMTVKIERQGVEMTLTGKAPPKP